MQQSVAAAVVCVASRDTRAAPLAAVCLSPSACHVASHCCLCLCGRCAVPLHCICPHSILLSAPSPQSSRRPTDCAAVQCHHVAACRGLCFLSCTIERTPHVSLHHVVCLCLYLCLCASVSLCLCLPPLRFLPMLSPRHVCVCVCVCPQLLAAMDRRLIALMAATALCAALCHGATPDPGPPEPEPTGGTCDADYECKYQKTIVATNVTYYWDFSLLCRSGNGGTYSTNDTTGHMSVRGSAVLALLRFAVSSCRALSS